MGTIIPPKGFFRLGDFQVCASAVPLGGSYHLAMPAGRLWVVWLGLLLVGIAVVCAAQTRTGGRRWAMYEHEMQTPADDPPDAFEEKEFAFARLRFRSYRRGGFYQRWGIDANRADRLFAEGMRRLTRVDTRSVEHIVDIDSDEIFEWPWLYAVSISDWVLSEPQIARLKTYFDRGGFLMVDDFHGEREWAEFMAGMSRILPGHDVIEIPDSHPMFQTVYDLSRRVRVPGYNVVYGNQVERGGVDPHWRAIVDDKGRVKVAICFNMDLGDAWEYADDAYYPEAYASMAYRMGVNYVIYAMSH